MVIWKNGKILHGVVQIIWTIDGIGTYYFHIDEAVVETAL